MARAKFKNGEIVAAGEFFFVRGRFAWVNNRSGTFLFPPESMKHFRKSFSDTEAARFFEITIYYSTHSSGLAVPLDPDLYDI